MSVQNISEVLFEKFLYSHGLSFEFEKPYPGKSKLVDYTVPIEGRDFLFEVKQFEQKDNPFPQGITALDPCKAIRAKIEQAKNKFKEYDGFPCCLVMYSNNAFVMDTEPHAVLGAMYGEIGISLPVQAGIVTVSAPPPETTFIGTRGRMYRHDRQFNTRITAVITMYEYHIGALRYGRWFKSVYEDLKAGKIQDKDIVEPADLHIEDKRLAVSVWKNIYAKVQFPDSLFRGPYDEHWGLEGDYVRRTYIGHGRIEDW